MTEQELIRKLADGAGTVPTHAEVLGIRQYSLDEMQARAKRLLATAGEALKLSVDRGDWVSREDRTLIRLPLGAHAVLYHASGAMKLSSGVNPMESLFKKVESRDVLTRAVENTARRLKIREWVGHGDSLELERLWQIKAQATDRTGYPIEPVLCRAIGAYRHYVRNLPVWGAASVAVKIAGDGALDSVTLQMRETSGELIERSPVLAPELAARQIVLQLTSLMGKSRNPASEMADPQWMRFGYLALSKRKPQRVLAPVYFAGIGIQGQQEAQAYVLAVGATEKTYLQLAPNGSEAKVGIRRATAAVA
jgi:hypothetical protein